MGAGNGCVEHDVGGGSALFVHTGFDIFWFLCNVHTADSRALATPYPRNITALP